MNETPLVAGPYSHKGSSIRWTMLLVIIALIPATGMGLYLFGWPAIYLFIVTVFSALLAEAGSLYVAGKPIRPFLTDGSALLTGWLVALTLPPWAPWWIGVVGSFLAIVIGKQVFGGLGQNLFNPAMVARIALLISFPLQMTSFIEPSPLFSTSAPGLIESLSITFLPTESFDALTSATPLGHVKTGLSQGITVPSALEEIPSIIKMFIGATAGSLGETSALLILLGGVFMLYKRVITWTIPVSLLVSLFLLAFVFNLVDPARYLGPFNHLMSGATMLAAFFIATDLVTSPVSVRGQLIFGAGCGLFIYVIRTWAGYPEGVGFAVLLMNACTPLIDHYFKPRVYGRNRKGQPLHYESDEASE